jgi:hypothetical protein
MLVESIALKDFVHDNIRAREGDPIELDEPTAMELERYGLVRVRIGPARGRRSIGASPGKVQAAGAPQPSSASPAARPSTPTTSPSSARGATPSQKPAKSSR